MKQKMLFMIGGCIGGVFLVFTLLVMVLPISRANAGSDTNRGSPGLVSYQGFLTDATGQPISGTVNLEFGLYATTSGGTAEWQETHNGVQVSNGYFAVLLGSMNPLTAVDFSSSTRFLQTAVDTGNGMVALPRQQLTAAPYALQAEQADNANSADSAPWSGLTDVPAGFADNVDDDTQYTAGTGLDLNSGIFSLETGYQLPQSCSSGQLPEWNGANWVCAVDNDTQYTAGTGLNLNSGTFSLATGYQLPQSCGNGDLPEWNGANWVCATDDVGGHYANRVVVAQSGGDFTSIQAALDSITDASPSNPYLVKVMPGVFTEQVTMKDYVDIEGSGEGVTKISYIGNASNSQATVIAASNAELRFLTIENTGGELYAKAVYSNNNTMRLTHVTLTAYGGLSVNWGMDAEFSDLTLNQVTVVMSDSVSNNYALWLENGSLTMRDTVFQIGNGVTQYGLALFNMTATLERVSMQFTGGSTNHGLYNFESATTANDMTITSAASNNNYGLNNQAISQMQATNLSVTLAGSGATYGVRNNGQSDLVLTNAALNVQGTAANYGIYNDSSSATLANITVVAKNGTTDYGIYNTATSGNHLVTLEQSRIQSENATIRNDAEFTVRVGNTRLAGLAVFPGGGTVTCAGVYDENYTFYASSCP